jgi:hypothetical protein
VIRRSGIYPVWREAAILGFRWALHDLQRKDPTHPDLPYIVLRLRTLLDERAAQPPSILRKAWQWL